MRNSVESGLELKTLREWALAVTLPHAEKRVTAKLADLGIAFHWFRRKLLIAHRGKLCERVISAFPRYIFVPLMYCWDVLRECKDVAQIIMFGETPARIADHQLDELRSQCTDDVLIETPAEARFCAGDKVLLLNLESSSRQAVFHRALGQGRSIVILDCMGRSIFVNVNESELQRVNTQTKVSRARRRRRRRNRAFPRNAHMPALELCPSG